MWAHSSGRRGGLQTVTIPRSAEAAQEIPGAHYRTTIGSTSSSSVSAFRYATSGAPGRGGRARISASPCSSATSLDESPTMVHQQKDTSSGSPGLVRARAPLSEANEDQIPASCTRATASIAADDIGGVGTTHGRAALCHPELRGLPLTEGYSPSFAYTALGGWDLALGG